MTESKFTPGPWICHSGMVWKDGPNVHPKGNEDGIPIARMDRDTPETMPTERDANARLIAAAPALLEALEACEDLLSELAEGGAENPELDKARAAIRAARGEA